VKLLVDVRAPERDASLERLSVAAAGLALRGHALVWIGPAPPFDGAPPPGFALAHGGLALARHRAQLVLAGPNAAHAGVAGRLVGAHGLVLALARDAVARWRAADRLAWQAAHALGLIDPGEADAMRENPLGLPLEQLAAWSSEPPPAVPDATHADVEILERACERLLARRHGAGAGAVFVDRDGTLVIERGYLADPDDLELLPGVPHALRELQAAGHPVIVISNQSGVGRGLFPLSRVYEAMARLRVLLRAHGVELDGVYFCPHRPDEGCPCRKPNVQLLERAAEDQGLSLTRSFVVGDKRLDVETAHRARGRGVLVRTGYGRDEERREDAATTPDAVVEDLASAARWILAQPQPRDLD
jgi:D-glycero-D-manno-heptose 1,7-bisphosphate phosphatase